MIKILFIGDIFGEPGRRAVKDFLPRLRKKYSFDLVIANCENAAHGKGVTSKLADEIFGYSVDFLTSGNHIWQCQDILEYLNKPDCRLIRPANFYPETPGKGWGVIETKGGVKVAIINIVGNLYMDRPADSPFRAVNSLIEMIRGKSDLIIVDMHAETTSEKKAMGWHVDGRVQACLGTHTHVQTADEEVLPGGCAYITDLGMTGPHDSVIGMNKEIVIKRFLTGMPVKFDIGKSDVRFCGAIIEIDEKKKRAVSIRRICERLN